MKKTFFVTGTDTDIGKTVGTVALLEAAAKRGLKAAALKPVASGCEMIDGQLRNEDVLRLQKAAGIRQEYDQLVAYAFEPFTAPHIAAEAMGVPIQLEILSEKLHALEQTDADVIFVEGAGGWRLPLGHGHFLSDWVKYENMPVIMVVGAQLGCINHALLTYEAIHHDMLELAGWCVNRVHQGMSHYPETLDTLKSMLPAPFLGEIPYLARPHESDLGQYLDLSALL